MIARAFVSYGLTACVAMWVAVSAAGQSTRPTARAAGPATQPAKAAAAEAEATETAPAKTAVRAEAKLEASLARFVPANVVFFVERAGHDAVKDAFDASNLGAMFHDPSLAEFIQDLRAQMFDTILEELYDLDVEADGGRNPALLQQLLTPIWRYPSAVFYLPTPEDTPNEMRRSFGLICVVPQDARKEPRAAIESVEASGVSGPSSKQQPFKWTTERLAWTGVAGSYNAFGELPTEAGELEKALEDKALFMTCWTEKYLLVATSLAAAEALDKGIADAKFKGLAAEADFQAVIKKTETPNWAFRWYVNPVVIGEMLDEDDREEARRTVKALGLENVRAIGGVAGYDKKTFVQRTFVLSPKTDSGLLRLFAAKGSYKPALAMVPRNAAFAMAGQVDPKAVAALIREVVLLDECDDDHDEDGDDEACELSEEAEAVLKDIADIAAGCNGHVIAFVGAMNMLDMMSDNPPPIGLVLGMKDEKAALDALASMRQLNMARHHGDDSRRGDRGERAAKTYREVVIHPLGRSFAAAMGDRLIVSLSQQGVRQAIDAAKDPEDSGGFGKDSKGEAYAALAGEGAGIFFVDLASIAKSFWPMLRTELAREGRDEENGRFQTLPDTDTLLKHLGPEVAVIENDPDGLLLQCTGLLPFATHWAGGYSGIGIVMMVMWGW